MATNLLLHKRTPWTAQDWLELPDDGRRYEITAGALLMAPPRSPLHQAVTDEIRQLLRPALPKHLRVQENTGVRLGDNLRIPDLVVLRAEAVWRPGALLAEDVLLVVEVVSPSSAQEDRVAKPAQFARAGVAHYWMVDPADGPCVHVLRLTGTVYERSHLGRGEDVLALREPVEVRFTPASLLPPAP
ncbi:Uma2 family endonuclease [Frankia sp. Cas4]|uniref:Uma2 family endonuclease n=1 Tax=Frankia sp. Cas4 TaxID=3073927 RepID=UPI002AD502DA|nr:Uma2 family endonuclease [Frankia sp. Cas4]